MVADRHNPECQYTLHIILFPVDSGNMTVVQTGLNSVEASWYPGVNGRIYYQQIGTSTIRSEMIDKTDYMIQLNELMEGENYFIYYVEELDIYYKNYSYTDVKATTTIFMGINECLLCSYFAVIPCDFLLLILSSFNIFYG